MPPPTLNSEEPVWSRSRSKLPRTGSTSAIHRGWHHFIDARFYLIDPHFYVIEAYFYLIEALIDLIWIHI